MDNDILDDLIEEMINEKLFKEQPVKKHREECNVLMSFHNLFVLKCPLFGGKFF